MARIQTLYERHPYQNCFEIYFVLAMIASLIIVSIDKGTVSLPMAITLMTELGLVLLYWAFGPGRTIPFGHTTIDGQKVPVRRPIIGFKSCERDQNRREDGYIPYRMRECVYRRALIRI